MNRQERKTKQKARTRGPNEDFSEIVQALNLAREKNIDYSDAVALLRRTHIILEHEGRKYIWIRCVP